MNDKLLEKKIAMFDKAHGQMLFDIGVILMDDDEYEDTTLLVKQFPKYLNKMLSEFEDLAVDISMNNDEEENNER